MTPIRTKLIRISDWTVCMERTLFDIQFGYMWECRFIWPWTLEAWHAALFPSMYPKFKQEEIYQSFRLALFWWMLNGGRSAQRPPTPPEIIERERSYRPKRTVC
jgi:hypothetical protein